MSTADELWLGELCFTLFYRTLAEKSGLPFHMTWKMLPYWERQSWIEAAKTIHEVGVNAKGLPAVEAPSNAYGYSFRSCP